MYICVMSVATCSFSVVFILCKHFVYCLEIKKMTQIKGRAASATDGRSCYHPFLPALILVTITHSSVGLTTSAEMSHNCKKVNK